MVAAAYGWAAHQAQVASVLAGARRPDQARQNARIASLDFPPGLLAALSGATAELKRALGSQADVWDMPGRMH